MLNKQDNMSVKRYISANEMYSQTLPMQYTRHSTPMIANLHAIISATNDADKILKTVYILVKSVLYSVRIL